MNIDARIDTPSPEACLLCASYCRPRKKRRLRVLAGDPATRTCSRNDVLYCPTCDGDLPAVTAYQGESR